VHAVRRDFLEKEVPGDALADQAPIQIGQRRDHRLDRTRLDLGAQLLEREPAGVAHPSLP
jgi:hypothetical protein